MKEKISKTEQSFFALFRAGLWEDTGLQFTACGLPGSGDEVEWSKVLDLAEVPYGNMRLLI